MKPSAEMSDAELQEARERIDDEVRSLNDLLRDLNQEIWVRQFDRDTQHMRPLNAQSKPETEQGEPRT